MRLWTAFLQPLAHLLHTTPEQRLHSISSSRLPSQSEILLEQRYAFMRGEPLLAIAHPWPTNGGPYPHGLKRHHPAVTPLARNPRYL